MSEIIPHWLDKQSELSPTDIAIESPNNDSISFLEMRKQSRLFAKKLAFLGVKQGDHVGILSGNSVQMVITIHALTYLGAVSVLLNTRLSSKEINYQLTDGAVTFLIVEEGMYAHGKEALHQLHLPIYTYSEIDRTDWKEVLLKREIDLDDPCTVIYTSGTTGVPKGVIHTYGNHWWSAVASALNLGLNDQDKWLASLPLFHVGGFSILMKSVIYGMPIYLLEKFEVTTAHKAITEKGVTIVSVVSITLNKLMDQIGDTGYPNTFRGMLLGGGPASKALLDRAKDYSIPVFQSYGMTETSSQIVTLSPKHATEKLGSAGKPLLPAQLKIVKDGIPARQEVIGEILVKGPMVTKGYFNKEKANQKLFQDGWLVTGDLGYLDKDGFLYVIDRRKDLIVSGGENIYPAEIEGVLANLKEIKEAAVVGQTDKKWGQTPIAFVVRDGSGISKEEIISYCQGQIAKYKVPKEIYFVDALPRNASNKIMRHILVDWLPKGDMESEH
ncbi:o-succinylbenzoate--CoA ligase [Aquibacillus sp. 3ASR75-11]|uniref:2-succinylbenzoate--CoA ligase n=1 Tax=Terrihalobacillus insolitus TaxID=2950438 RepID=A0A9X4ALW7_9BACI|nr:o-succinylbenzoate--CoA ligase [Terrihalobacillus insolitus]MDC3412404.1 o-succinylbenzoate--CoA ligase [Terrihalobacillus insolitus]MDC3422903.1 o-succinylbenzoate--CoA ligase [Terrihalobacillus insolitus]